jgi:hypothetical protein
MQPWVAVAVNIDILLMWLLIFWSSKAKLAKAEASCLLKQECAQLPTLHEFWQAYDLFNSISPYQTSGNKGIKDSVFSFIDRGVEAATCLSKHPLVFAGDSRVTQLKLSTEAIVQLSRGLTKQFKEKEEEQT